MVTIFFVHDLKGTFFAFMNADMKNQNIIQQKSKTTAQKNSNFGKKISVHNSTLFSTIMTHYYTFFISQKSF